MEISSHGLGSCSFARHYSRNRCFTFSSSAYLVVSVQRVPLITLCIHVMITQHNLLGFPHSEIHGSQIICISPWLIAAYHVLHRRLVPRHPLYALCSLIIFSNELDYLSIFTNFLVFEISYIYSA